MNNLNNQSTSVLQEKAQWYREVLDLEPGSKVFFPYAKLLVQLGRSQEAAAVLMSGLDRHPEFTEARLFLISLLHEEGEEGLCAQQVSRLAGLFSEYPAFWDAWSTYSNQSGQKPDLSLSLSFLGAMLRDQDLTMLDVMSRGLQNLQSGQPAVQIAPRPAAQPVRPAPQPAAKSVESQECRVPVPEAPQHVRHARQEDDEELTGEEKSSLRTRSMAEVLAEQGDVRGALDIYNELLANTQSAQEKAELNAAMDALKGKIGQENQSSAMHVASASSKPKSAAALPQSGVIDLLEKLAVRLETKAKQ